MPRFAYGGQALMEGVLMRGQHAIGVAVRGPDGRIFGGQEKLDSVLHRNRFARAPFFRGVVVLYETLVIGTRWLMRSGSLAAAGEGVSMGGATLAITLLITLSLAIGLFVLVPLFIAQGATNASPSSSTSWRVWYEWASSLATCSSSAARPTSGASSSTTAPST